MRFGWVVLAIVLFLIWRSGRKKARMQSQEVMALTISSTFDPEALKDPKLSELSLEFHDKFLNFWQDLFSATHAHNQAFGTNYRWRIYSLRREKRPGDRPSRHHTGDAADLALVNQRYQLAFKPGLANIKHNWQILEILRATAKRHNLEWGGLYRGEWEFDSVHIENDAYKSKNEPRWFNLQPEGTVRYE